MRTPHPITSRICAILLLTGFPLLFFLVQKKPVITKIPFFSLYMYTNQTRVFFKNHFIPSYTALFSVNRFHILNAYTVTLFCSP